MSKIRTLNEIRYLESSGYGRPCPRHGLHLLYWFCNDYVSFDNNGDLMASEHPETEDFGFHCFFNRFEDDGYHLLPHINIPYYEVGNLFFPGADDLPDYVRSNYTKNHTSNMDRIIISIHPDIQEVDKVYVTQHHGEVSFDHQNTFCISKGLVRIIMNLTLDGLLCKVGYRSETESLRILPMNRPSYRPAYTETPREPAVAQTHFNISPQTHVIISPQKHVTISPQKHFTISPQKHFNISPQTHVIISPQKHFNISPQKHFNISPQKHFNISPQTHFNISPQKHFNISPQKHFNISPQKHFNISPQKHFNISPQTHVIISPQKHFNISPQKHFNISPQKHFNISPETHVTISPESRGGRSPGSGERELRDDKPDRICYCVIL